MKIIKEIGLVACGGDIFYTIETLNIDKTHQYGSELIFECSYIDTGELRTIAPFEFCKPFIDKSAKMEVDTFFITAYVDDSYDIEEMKKQMVGLLKEEIQTRLDKIQKSAKLYL